MQKKQAEWYEQWSMLQDDELFLFTDWIYPNSIDDFKNKDALECGCGAGQHTSFIAPHAKSVTAVDLNTIQLAQDRNKNYRNICFIESDIATMDLKREFDIVFSIGVIHHTDNPDLTVANLKKHLKTGGRLIIWVYSREGNELVDRFVEPMRKKFFIHLDRKTVLFCSKLLTAFLSIIVYTVYLLPLRFLPYYEYFENFRKLSFKRNVLNVFDKLNAPQVEFIAKGKILQWFNREEFRDMHLSHYKGISWRASATKV